MILLKLLNQFSVKVTLIAVLTLLLMFSCKNNNEDTSEIDPIQEISENTPLGTKKSISKILSNPLAEELFLSDSVKKFYAERENSSAWSNNEMRKDFIEILKNAEVEGLYFADYHGKEIENIESSLNSQNNDEKSRYDILLTDAYFQFGSHLLNGKTDPQKIHEIFDIPKNRENLSLLLKNALAQNNLDLAFNKLRPNHPVYNQLITSLKVYKEKMLDSDKFQEIDGGEMIKPGMQDVRLPKIKFRLMALGYLKDIDTFSNDHSRPVQDAIKQLQLENGLLSDGIIGNSTIKLLNIDYKDRYNQILANLERWRWYPRDLGDHYILVNIANYHLDVVKNDELVRSHKTMVGTDIRKTPIFSEEIKYIVFNPNWTIPPTIKTKDVIPGARKDPNYLNRKKIDVYSSNGVKLDPSEVDWNSNKVKSYTYRQKPGSSNPLGKVKIIYPNKHLIYLHDTPSKSLFSRNSRAQSSGCIRVEHVMELAEYLLSDQPTYKTEKINEILETGKLTEVRVQQRVKVHHLYWTAWLENEKPRFTEDIYNYDEKIIKELNKVSKP
ncbi:murein L,D-transpeptidase YcbB/YkuD [Gillisia mitskevichiae]|uniref:Murein L,D-transpeptidase YcbB/YkuD n=1 Tax=Gillisia mitskevichiae TaxID=270921 RepID=A0A495NZW2_9FLAO|nr:L,D-transpeptidase family protein [Gillisia mitskevichiae]RKS43427.1 murein L,D-transpeptidase YcbB/YkuD [Gillisia mitskevichiae]